MNKQPAELPFLLREIEQQSGIDPSCQETFDELCDYVIEKISPCPKTALATPSAKKRSNALGAKPKTPAEQGRTPSPSSPKSQATAAGTTSASKLQKNCKRKTRSKSAPSSPQPSGRGTSALSAIRPIIIYTQNTSATETSKPSSPATPTSILTTPSTRTRSTSIPAWTSPPIRSPSP